MDGYHKQSITARVRQNNRISLSPACAYRTIDDLGLNSLSRAKVHFSLVRCVDARWHHGRICPQVPKCSRDTCDSASFGDSARFGIMEARETLCVFITATSAPIMANIEAAADKQVFKCKVQSRCLKSVCASVITDSCRCFPQLNHRLLSQSSI